MKSEYELALTQFQVTCRMYDMPEHTIQSLFDMVRSLGEIQSLEKHITVIEATEFERDQG